MGGGREGSKIPQKLRLRRIWTTPELLNTDKSFQISLKVNSEVPLY